MLALTRKTDYALVSVAALAAWAPSALSARELADRLGAPPAMLRNLLKDLAAAGILKSLQGSQGGYLLARDPDDILVGEVIRAIEGEPVLARCCTSEGHAAGEPLCSIESECRIKGAVRRLHLRVRELIETVTIRDLLEAEATGEERVIVGIGIDRSVESAFPGGSRRWNPLVRKDIVHP